MIFNTLTYFICFLFPCVFLFHKVSIELKPWIITIFGVIFFVYFAHIHFGGAWGSLCVLIFIWELLVSRLYKPGSKWCIFGAIQAILILFIFKYLVFFSNSWNEFAHLINFPPLTGIPKLALPLGVSFFTFEFIHFAVDIYQGKIQEMKMSTYAAFIFFFPTMVAGPIKRYQDFEPDLKAAKFDPRDFTLGLTRILAGLTKKHVLADTFSLWADRLNSDMLFQANGSTIFFWILAYGLKIYFDFSAYSDIAIGCAKLFGLKVPENFDWPYISQNITEFWRRWHISLGRWIFDYIYKPLGGSKGTEARTSLNLVLAFTVSGLWHGAAYNFIAWGFWHGSLMAIHRFWRNRGTKLPIYFAVPVTYFATNLGWAFFCMDMDRALFAFSKMLGVQ